MKKMTFNRSPLESNLVKKVETYIKTTFKEKAWFFNIGGNASQRSGVPDILVCINGRLIGLELKREDGTGRPSKQQEIECRKINNAGGIAIITNNFEQIKKLLNDVYNNKYVC